MAYQDFITLSGTVSFLPGERTKTISFPILNDALNEPHKRMVVELLLALLRLEGKRG